MNEISVFGLEKSKIVTVGLTASDLYIAYDKNSVLQSVHLVNTHSSPVKVTVYYFDYNENTTQELLLIYVSAHSTNTHTDIDLSLMKGDKITILADVDAVVKARVSIRRTN